jgi:hypothetical protein
MDDAEGDDRMDIEASYSSVIADFRAGLLQWLGRDDVDDFEDRQLDALLLKVRLKGAADED